jgi:hypothetical protein
MTGMITGEESWLETPAGRSWKAAYAGCPEHYRWAPEQVASALLKAHAIVAAEAGRVGPKTTGGASIFGMASSGLPSPRFLPHEVTWAQSVVLWPKVYLLDESDIARRQVERKAVRIWIRRETGERLEPSERALYKTPAHRKARKRGLVVIAAGLMRDRVPPMDGQAPDRADAAPIDRAAPTSSPVAWQAPDIAEDAALMPSPQDVADIAQAIADDAEGLPGDPRAIAGAIARRAAETWLEDHPPGTMRMARATRLTARLKAAALAIMWQDQPA